MGGLTETGNAYWGHMRDGGVDVRCFNPPRFDSPLGWLSRLHRKSLCVDGSVAYVSGLCVGRMWTGYPEKNIPPWRDTGVEIRGPVVADIVQSFSRAWAETGPELPANEIPTRDALPVVGAIDIRVLGDSAATAGLYRLEQLIAVLAQNAAGSPTHTSSAPPAMYKHCEARPWMGWMCDCWSRVRVDLKFLRPVSRAGYRPLLEAGVRVFEWNGSMLHAKTAVADGRWARVGSSNLNLASWIGNWELDVAVENLEFGDEMEQMYLQDLDNATEIILSEKNRVRPVTKPSSTKPALPARKGLRQPRSGSASRLTAGAIRVGNTVGAAITSKLVLGAAEAKIMLFGGGVLLALAVAAILHPLLIVVPFVLISGWIGLSLLMKAYHSHANGSDDTALNGRFNRTEDSGRPAKRRVENTLAVARNKA